MVLGSARVGGIGFYNNSEPTLNSLTHHKSTMFAIVSPAPPSGVTTAESWNNSWCHDIAGGSFPNYCDDDYSDSDGDGLADWEETLGVFGFFSNPTLVDSDGDGEDDFDELMAGLIHLNRD